MNVFSIPIIGVCLVLVNGPIWWNWSTALTVLIFFGIMTGTLALIRMLKLWEATKF